jgi:hypothetical protein
MSVVKNPCFISSHNGVQKLISFLCVHLLLQEIVWRNAPHIWWDYGSMMPFQTSLTHTNLVLPLSDEHSSQVKDQGRRQCCHNRHTKFPYWPTHDVSLFSGHASCYRGLTFPQRAVVVLLESDATCTSLNCHCAGKSAVLIFEWCYKIIGDGEQVFWRYWLPELRITKWYDKPKSDDCLCNKFWLWEW